MMETEKVKPAFLRKMDLPSRGEAFPNAPILTAIDKPLVNLHEMITDHLLLVLGSSHCQPCLAALEALDEHIKIHPELNAVLLIDTSFAQLDSIRRLYENRVQVYLMPVHVMRAQMGISAVPSGFYLDSSGIILGSASPIGLNELKIICASPPHAIRKQAMLEGDCR